MIATITKDGFLKIMAQGELERYALGCWSKDNHKEGEDSKILIANLADEYDACESK